jgi:hypothetical protein
VSPEREMRTSGSDDAPGGLEVPRFHKCTDLTGATLYIVYTCRNYIVLLGFALTYFSTRQINTSL